jgi:prepilin-type processing-associated H-X9-DG protein
MVSKENYRSGNKDVNSAYRIGELTSAPQTAAFVTAVNWLVQYGGRDSWDGVEGKVNAPRIAYRHNNKALVVYYDGHVGEISKEDMKELDRRGGQNNCFWKGRGGTP